MVAPQPHLNPTFLHSEPRASLTDRESVLPLLNTTAFLMLTAFTAAVPFPYGAVTAPSTFLLTGSAFVIGAVTFLTRPRTGKIAGALMPVIALLLIAVLGAFQLVPMSPAVLHDVAPASATIYADANEILHLFGRSALKPRISIAPADTEATTLLALAYVVLFLSAAILASTRIRRRILTGVFIASSALQLLYSVAATPSSERLHGTFINPNHFAGYLEITLSFAFALVWRELLHNRERGQGFGELGDRLERRIIPMVLAVLLWAVVAAGLTFTRSRGGIIAAAIGMITLVVMAPLQRRGDTRVTAAAPAVVVSLLAVLVFIGFTAGATPLVRFLASDPRALASDTRTELWNASIAAFHLSPTFGTGLGTFREAFRRVQPASIEGLVEQAHNDLLQMLVTGGWVGAALVTIAFVSMLVVLVRAWLKQQHREESAFALAGIGAMISLMLHGLVEFNMSIPAIPATLAVMVGLAWAAARYETKTVTLRAADPEP